MTISVSQLIEAGQAFIKQHGDGEVKLLWEQGVLDENYDPNCLEQPTDIRTVNDWPLPGESLVNKAETPEKMFVIMYGEYIRIPKSAFS